MYKGQSLQLAAIDMSGVYELCFDRQGDVINKFDEQTIRELDEACKVLKGLADLRGVLVTSAKNAFIVGADITEFGQKFRKSSEEIATDVRKSNDAFVMFEDLDVPSVVAINGFALGGGLEFALANSIRVIATVAQVGVPEVKLGLFPGFGGTVRLVRVAGPAVACEWVVSGKPANSEEALACRIVDAVAEPETLRATALKWLDDAMNDRLDWKSRQQQKRIPLNMERSDLDRVFDEARSAAKRKSPVHQPAALAAVEMMQAGSLLDRTGALWLEAKVFGEIARTQAASSMIRTFLSEQELKRITKRHVNGSRLVASAAVLGAGIMGGGIAYTSAFKGVPVRMRDIRREALDQGLAEVEKQLKRLLKLGRLTEVKAQAVRETIFTQTDGDGFQSVDMVVEAIVENLEVKQKVLAELEATLEDNTIIASNTSSLRISDIGVGLKRPENFVGMHFFNPVPMMALVEVVKGKQTSAKTVATAVAYATTLGKTPIVVKDCPGFLVNRVFTSYIRAFLQLLSEGADFQKIDQVMESFGWPMGPAYLEDVIGMDTGSHVNNVISAGYPLRMPTLQDDALQLMVRNGRFGQKSGLGFYRYEVSPDGKPIRVPADDTHALLVQIQPQGSRDFSDPEILDRMLMPMIIESAHALEECIVETPAELDLAMQLGLGFPAYAGGPLKFADWLGLSAVVARCERLRHLGEAYEPTKGMRKLAAAGAGFY